MLCNKQKAFSSRGKSNTKFKRIDARRVDKSTGLICDQVVELTVFYSQQGYPERLRPIRYRDRDGRRLVFIANHMTLPAVTVCDLYRMRWQ